MYDHMKRQQNEAEQRENNRGIYKHRSPIGQINPTFFVRLNHLKNEFYPLMIAYLNRERLLHLGFLLNNQTLP